MPYRRAQSGHDTVFEGVVGQYTGAPSPDTVLFSGSSRVPALGNPRVLCTKREAYVPLGAPAIRREPVLEKASVAKDTAPRNDYLTVSFP